MNLRALPRQALRTVRSAVIQVIDARAPELGRRLRRLRRPARLGTIRRTRPLSDDWGRDRGTPVDRYYVERFMADHRTDIRGRVLELLDGAYTERFGIGVVRADVLDIDASNPRATLVADLAAADAVAGEQFDCFILTQTLQFIADPGAAVRHAHRLLRPGGVLLATVPTTSRIGRRTLDGEYWRFTPAACRRLFGEVFGSEHVTVRGYGNVLASVAFLVGMAAEELTQAELDAEDPHFPLLVAVRAVRAVREVEGDEPGRERSDD